MSRILALFLTAVGPLGASVQLLATLPNGASPTATQLDAAGNIYVAGSFVPTSKNFLSAFVAKLSADGSQVLYFTVLAGSANDVAAALTLGSDGSAYVGGSTVSPDFPITAGALDATSSAGIQGFLAKVNPAGSLVYSTFINGATDVTGIALDTAGDVFLTGLGALQVSSISIEPALGFVMEVNATLNKVLLSANGYGGGLIALDSQGNIYVTGSAQPSSTPGTNVLTLPMLSAGAFQPTHDARFCFIAENPGPNPSIFMTCLYQYVAKINSTGALVWATYVTGSWGAIAGGMAVDSAGNVIVAGTTYSDDYPVTPGAFQTAYTAAAPFLPAPAGSMSSSPPAATGYISKINASGTGLIWSTYFGGSFSDQITGLAVGANGEIFVSGHSDSSDLPGLAGTPDGCHPTADQELAFVARVAQDGTTAGPTELLQGAPDCLYYSCGSLVYNDLTDYPGFPVRGALTLGSNGTLVFADTDGNLASIDFSARSRLSCVVDPADYAQLRTVAPGQLLTLFGTDLAPETPVIPASGVAASTANLGVFFNGIPAPILYSGAQQINVQVPYEIAGQSSVEMQVVDNQVALPVSETITLGVAAREPAVYLTPAALESLYPASTVCGGVVVFGVAALALNADGTLNDCSNPAIAGSVVTLFVDGLGPVMPALATGAIAAAPAVTLTPGIAGVDDSNGVIGSTTLTLPGAITGLAQWQLQLPTGLPAGRYDIAPFLGGVPLRERLILVWVRPE